MRMLGGTIGAAVATRAAVTLCCAVASAAAIAVVAAPSASAATAPAAIARAQTPADSGSSGEDPFAGQSVAGFLGKGRDSLGGCNVVQAAVLPQICSTMYLYKNVGSFFSGSGNSSSGVPDTGGDWYSPWGGSTSAGSGAAGGCEVAIGVEAHPCYQVE